MGASKEIRIGALEVPPKQTATASKPPTKREQSTRGHETSSVGGTSTEAALSTARVASKKPSPAQPSAHHTDAPKEGVKTKNPQESAGAFDVHQRKGVSGALNR